MSANAFEILISARDNASATLGKVGEAVQGVGVQAGFAAERVGDLGKGLFNVGEVATGVVKNLFGSVFDGVGKVLSVFGGLYSGFEQIRATIESPLGQTFFSQIGEAIDEIVAQQQFLTRVLSDVGSVFSNIGSGINGTEIKKAGSQLAVNLADGFNITLKQELGAAANKVDQVLAEALKKLDKNPKELAGAFGGFADALEPIAGAAEPLGVFELVEKGVGASTNAIFELSQKLAFLGLGFQALKGLVENGPFDLLIGQNIRLQEQLLSTQASLAATNNIILNGNKISDPTQAIKALGPAVDDAIAKIRKDSLELVGVTSKDLVDLFQIVSGQASNIGANLTQSADIVTSTAAALGTLGVPLFQSRQEISSIIQGTIDMNSVLAKNLNINNEMVAKWKAQGTFVDELLKRLEAFKSGNKLASQTISGITSNIQELFDEIGRGAGAKFLAPIVKELDGVYQFLTQNKDAIGKGLEDLVNIFAKAVGNIVNSLKALVEPFFKIFSNVPTYLLKSLTNFTETLANSIGLAVAALKPALEVFAALAPAAGALGGLYLTLSLGAKTLAFAVGGLDKAFNLLALILPYVGELLFFVDLRNNGLINKFATLTDIVGRGSAGFLIYGENLLKIPGAAAGASKELGKLLGGLAPFAPALTGLIPLFSSVAIKVIGFTQVFPELIPVLQKVGVAIPTALRGLQGLTSLNGTFSSLAPLIGKAADGFENFVFLAGQSDKVNEMFSQSMKAAGGALRGFVIQTALLGAGGFAGFVFLDQFIIKNKGLQKVLESVTGAIRNFADAVTEKLTPIFNALREVFAFLFQFQKDDDGRGGNLFGNILGGVVLAIAAVKLFGNAISTAFKGINVGVSTLGDNIIASVTKLDKVRKSISATLKSSTDPERRTLVSDAEAPSVIQGKKDAIKAQESIIIGSSKSLRNINTSSITFGDDISAYESRLKAQRLSAIETARSLKNELANIDIATPLTSQLSKAAIAVGAFAKKLGFDIKFALNDIEAAFKSKFGAIPAIIGSAIGGIKGFVGNQVNNAKFLFNDIEAGARKIPAAVKGIGSAISSEFKTFAADPSKYLLSTGIAIEATARSYLAAASKNIKQFVSDFGTNITKLPKLATDAFNSIASGGLKGLGTSISNLYKSIDLQTGFALTKFVNGFKTSFKTVGKAFLSLASELGPSLLIGGAVAVFTAAVGEIDRQNQLATKSSKDLADALKDIDNRLRISDSIDSKNVGETISKLTKDRKDYIASFKDDLKLKDDPTLKSYDLQIGRLKELQRLQDTPRDTENKLREQVKKNRDNFGVRVTEFGAGLGDVLRNLIAAPTFGLSNKLGLGDRAGNLEEKEVQTIQAASGKTFAEIQEKALKLRTTGLEKQKLIEKELIKLEQEKATASATGNTNEADKVELLIKAKQEEKSERLNAVDALIKQAEATQDVDGKQSESIKILKEVRKQLEGAKAAIEAVDLPRIGNAIEQASAKYKAALDALNKSAGDPAIFKAKLGELLEVAKELQDAGILRADEAANQFARIATNVAADRDLQIKAQQAITEVYQKEAQRRVGIYDAQISQIKALQAQGKISESEAVGLTGRIEEKKLLEQLDAVTEINKSKKAILEKNAKEEQENIQRDRKLAEAQKAAASGDVSKVQKFREELSPTLDKKSSELKNQIKEGNEQLKALESQLSKGELGGAEATKKIDDVKLSLTGLTQELRRIDEQKGKLDSSLKLSTESKKQLDDTVGQINAVETELKGIQKERDKLEIQGKKGFRVVDELGVKDAAIAQRQAKLRELNENKSQLESIIKPDPEAAKRADGDIANQNKKESDLQKNLILQRKKFEEDANKDRLEAESKVLEARANNAIRQLDAQIKETLNKAKLGETQRLADIAKLRKGGIKLESEIQGLELDEKAKATNLELNLELQKQAKIAELKKSGKGYDQKLERENLIRIAELTKTQSDDATARINNLIAQIRDRLTLAANQYGVAIEQANLKLERQKLLYTALEKSLENQGRLADSSKKLSDSIVAVREADLNVLTKIYDKQQQAIRDAGGTGNFADLELEEKKKILTEQMAKIKFESLLRQQTFEKESLEREIQKRDLLLERQKLENKIRTESAKADLAIAQVDVKAAEAEVRQRPDSLEAKLKLDKARLEQQKKEIGFAGLVQEGGFLQETGRINGIQAGQEREGLANKFRAERISGASELALNLNSDVDREAILNELRQSSLSRTGNPERLTASNVRNLINTPLASTQGASLTDPSKYGDVLKRTTANGTLTTEPVKPVNNAFTTSFAELQQKYPDKGLGDLNSKYGGKDAQTFEELNAKYSGKPVTQEATTSAIASSFDNLNKQIDEGFTKTLIAPQMKVDEMTGKLESEFNRITKQITENPVQLKIDEKLLDDQLKKLEKPIAVLDEKQLQRLEAIAASLGVGGQNVNPQTAQNAAVGIGTTVNANVTVNQQGGVGSVAGVDVKAGVRDALDTILKRVAGVTSGTK